MVKPKNGDQLWLFPFVEIVRDRDEFLLNLAILKDWRQDMVFTAEMTNEDECSKFIWCAFDVGAYITTRINLVPCSGPPEGSQNSLDKEEDEDFLKCKECGAPAIYFLDCSCGTYTWCEEHEDAAVLWDHADHECSPECCARGHSAEIRSVAELEAMISQMEIHVEANGQKGDMFIFTIEVRQKSERECMNELKSLMNKYSVLELEGKLKTEIDYTEAPLAIGSQAIITPHDFSDPTLALAVVRHEGLFIITVAGKKSKWDYVCLLPEGVVIPGHSQAYEKPGFHYSHYIVLSRDELEPVSSKK